ncbi:MAG: isopentenyl-diphosphate delta-isomerase [Bacteriovoracaceae bacterium]
MEEINKRKQDHIDLANLSQMVADKRDIRFFYEPLLGKHPSENPVCPTKFLGFDLGAPIWVSSMTGGAHHAGKINKNLAQACKKFRLGMGLGSCRPLLTSDQFFDDFNLRPIIGDDLPLFANLGISQIEKMVLEKDLASINSLLERLKATGLVVHINPLQEWLQPEGDRLTQSPIETIRALLKELQAPLIVKEVGQGMGPSSLALLMRLPLAAIEFGSFGGTNFSKLELLRQSADSEKYKMRQEFSYLGHDCQEMVYFVNTILGYDANQAKCKEFILSGGIKSFLDGHFLMNKLVCPSVYGQAHKLLEVAKISYDRLDAYLTEQIIGLNMAKEYLRSRS